MAARTPPAPRRRAGVRPAHLSVPRDEPDRRGVHRRPRPGGDGGARRQAAALGAARPAAGVPAAAAVVVGAARAQDAAEGRVARRPAAAVGGSALLCGFYLNELLLKLLPREDPHPRALRRVRGGAGASSPRRREQATVLRRFELALLAELGYALPLVREADTGAPVDPAARYHYAFDRGPQRAAPPEPGARGCRSCAARRCWRWPRAAIADAETAARGEAADARSARPLPRAARRREPARRAGPAGDCDGETEHGERPQ